MADKVTVRNTIQAHIALAAVEIGAREVCGTDDRAFHQTVERWIGQAAQNPRRYGCRERSPSMKHPTQHAEQIDVLTRALSIAAQQTAGNDAAKACGLVDLWILMASAQYVAELKQQAGETTTCAH